MYSYLHHVFKVEGTASRGSSKDMDLPHKGRCKYLPSDELEMLSLKLKTS